MMVIAVGLSSYNIALFHLVNHASNLNKVFNLRVVKFTIGYLLCVLSMLYSTNKMSSDNYAAKEIKTQKSNDGISLTKEVLDNKLNPFFVTGFSDGESSFIVRLKKSDQYKAG